MISLKHPKIKMSLKYRNVITVHQYLKDKQYYMKYNYIYKNTVHLHMCNMAAVEVSLEAFITKSCHLGLQMSSIYRED